MQPILVTGFEPFGGEPVNPSQQVVESLPASVAGRDLVTAILPVDPVTGIEACFAAVERWQPAAVVALGQSGAPGVQVERVFVNLFHPAPDADHVPVVAGGPDGLFGTLDVAPLVRAGARLSLSAGSYVCNALGYQLAHRYGRDVPSAFVHLPFLPEQRPGQEGTMPLSAQRAAVLALLEAAAASLA